MQNISVMLLYTTVHASKDGQNKISTVLVVMWLDDETTALSSTNFLFSVQNTK